MKVRNVQDSRNQHLVAVEHEGILRVYHSSPSIHVSCIVAGNLKIDIKNNVFGIDNLAELPVLTYRISAKGRRVYSLAA